MIHLWVEICVRCFVSSLDLVRLVYRPSFHSYKTHVNFLQVNKRDNIFKCLPLVGENAGLNGGLVNRSENENPKSIASRSQ